MEQQTKKTALSSIMAADVDGGVALGPFRCAPIPVAGEILSKFPRLPRNITCLEFFMVSVA